MTTNAALSTTASVAPSEIMMLNCEEFVIKGFFRIFENGPKALADGLAVEMVILAILANEQAGVISLSTDDGLQPGIKAKKVLTMSAGGEERAWPEGSIEAHLCSYLHSNTQEPKCNVFCAAHALLEESTREPCEAILNQARDAMTARGFFDTETEKKMLFFKRTKFLITEKGKPFVSAEAAAPSKSLWKDYEENQFDKYMLIRNTVVDAIYAHNDDSTGGADGWE